MHRSKGFTLVELVVVMAIIGVLAAILVPAMMNYIRKAQLKSANTNAKTAYNAVAEFITDRGTEGDAVATTIAGYGNQIIDCRDVPASPLNANQQAVFDVLAQNGISSGIVWVGDATINNVESFFVQWTGVNDPDHTADPVFGQFPDAITWEDYKSGVSWKAYNP